MKRVANRSFALGRIKTGQMNKTEEAYFSELNTQKSSGLIAWFKFEGVKLRLADNTFYTPDFAVMRADGTMELHEVKGFWTDDARVKIKSPRICTHSGLSRSKPKAKRPAVAGSKRSFNDGQHRRCKRARSHIPAGADRCSNQKVITASGA